MALGTGTAAEELHGRAVADFRLRAERVSLASDFDVLRENWLDIVASPAKTSFDFFRLMGRPELIQLLLLLNLQ